MPGRLVYAPVPYERASPDWLSPAYFAGNLAVYGLNVLPARTARVRWGDALPALQASQRDAWRPILYVAWHRHNYASIPALLALPEALRPTLVMHDGAASRALTHASSAWIGFDALVYRRRSPVSPRQQMIDYVLREQRHLFVLPDAGGPYLRMKPGVLEIAARTRALVQPLAFRCRPSVTVGRRLRHVLPLPFATIDVHAGPLLEDPTAEACQDALVALERATRE
jgi:hypothetical protein